MVSRHHLVATACLALALGARPLRSDEQPQAGAAPNVNPTAAPETDTARFKLVFKFYPSQIVRYEVVTEQEIKTSARDEVEIQKNYTRAKRHHRVLAVDDKTGAGDLQLSIDWVYMRAVWDKGDGVKPLPIEFQSDDPEKHPAQFKDILATVGKPLATIRFRPTGNLLKVVAAPAQPQGKGGPVQGADSSFEAHLIVLPEQPVAVGESWKEKFDVVALDEHKNLTKITIQRIYKLTEVKAGRAKIELKTAILTPGLNPAVLSQFLLSEVSGKIVFDVERGMILSKDLTAQNTVVNPIPDVSSQMQGKLHYTENLIGDGPSPERTAAGPSSNSKK